jgi:KaiC/GvpD/RAD55 family RecA-like ATPase
MTKREKDKHKYKIEDLLKSHSEGLTIADVMKHTKLARHTVLARLHTLVGQGHVEVRKINMAKVHYWTKDRKGKTKPHVKVREIKHEHVKKSVKKFNSPKKIDLSKIREEIENQLKAGNLKNHEAKIKSEREEISKTIGDVRGGSKKLGRSFIDTGVPGFDDLFFDGVPKGSTILLAGGAGSGKTILSLQMLNHHAKAGKKCLYMSFEESEERLIQHMEDFGWDPHDLIKKNKLAIKRFNPFDITRSVDALLMKSKGELLIDIEPIIFPSDFQPDVVVVDSLTAIASAFTGKEDSYRIYIEQLFRFFEKISATAFMITETEQIPKIFSSSGVEEFLADGVIVLYNIKRGNIRENAIEVLKLRGAKHDKKIVAMQITDDGITVYPDQEVFGGID